MTAGGGGRGPLPAGKMVAAEHNILEKQHSSHMETSGLADLFERTVAVHAGDLVMSSTRPSIAMEQDLHFSAAHRLRPSLWMLPRRSTDYYCRGRLSVRVRLDRWRQAAV